MHMMNPIKQISLHGSWDFTPENGEKSTITVPGGGWLKHTRIEPDLRFRIVLEQAWSVEHFRKTANPKDWERLKGRIQSGDFELTALYGNQITEIMNGAEMRRLLAPSQRIAREIGIELVSAEHNDETGVSWGLCQALADADVKVICPGFALYYRWGDANMPPFWDEEAVFGRIYQPGAFWWEAPNGKRVLLWCNNTGCGGDNSCTLDSLEREILRLSDLDWPDSVLRFPVGGADRDNSPYSDGWINAAEKWNEEWSSPHIIISTNARFYKDYIQKLSRELPVRRGDLPGQDYPPGAMSIPEVTVAAHGAATTLEQIMPLAEAASAISGYDTARIADEAYDNLLLAHEHAWGFHFPAGYAARASQIEKLSFAVRAEAFADELRAKSMALLADRIQSDGSDMRLVVYNPGGDDDLAMEIPLREFDNTGSQMAFYNNGTPRKRGYLLVNRMHVTPPNDHFKLIDMETGEEMPIEVSKIEADTPERFASERHALAQGTRRLSLFELPEGLGRTMRFVARSVPPQGYVSQAHRCQALAEGHAPLSLDDYQKNGHVYSMLFSNNYGTNFTASGSGEVLYRFRIGAYPDGASIFTDRSKEILPAVGSLAQISGK